MTIKDGTKIIVNKYPNMSIIECLDFPEFYAFAIVDKGKEDEGFGGGYITVNKTDGGISSFNPTMDLQLFMSAKPIDVN